VCDDMRSYLKFLVLITDDKCYPFLTKGNLHSLSLSKELLL
jgi:hypothetical protein